MKILLITAFYPPEIRSASNLMLELAQELSTRGHEVTVITTWPEYNLPEATSPNRFEEEVVEDGIKTVRVRTFPRYNVNYIKRGMSELLMPLQFILKLRKLNIFPEVVIAYSPPLLLSFVGSWYRTKGIPFILNVQDLFPQNAVDLGVLKNPLLIWLFRKIEALVYRSASKITLHSAGNRKHILGQFPNIENKMSVLHNWVDISHHACSSENIDFRERFGIHQKHIALFAGVMGPSQHLELVLNIAEKMKAQDEWLFLFVGDGAEKDRLRKIARSQKLNNVCFKGFVSRDEYPDLLKICSCGLVCLSPLNKTPVVPGKILGYMAAGLPVVAFLHPNSDGHGIIRDAGCGVSADSGDEAACEKIMRCFMQNNLDLDAFAREGKKHVVSNYSKEICVDQLEEILSK